MTETNARIVQTTKVTADLLRRLEHDVWHDDTYRWYIKGLRDGLTADGKRQMNAIYKAARMIATGFTPFAYTDVLETRSSLLLAWATCDRCGHTLRTRKLAWMRKHNETKHGVGRYSAEAEGDFREVLGRV